jgi:small subunit ribosomal protein S18
MKQQRKTVKKVRTPKVSPIGKDKTVDYKDIALLSKFISERGKILPRSKTGVSSKQQRMLTIAIKRARHVALLPFIVRT